MTDFSTSRTNFDNRETVTGHATARNHCWTGMFIKKNTGRSRLSTYQRNAREARYSLSLMYASHCSRSRHGFICNVQTADCRRVPLPLQQHEACLHFTIAIDTRSYWFDAVSSQGPLQLPEYKTWVPSTLSPEPNGLIQPNPCIDPTLCYCAGIDVVFSV